MATPQIQTPDYQGYADRVTPALDKLLMGYQERKKREAEERQFARKKAVMKSQQDFQKELTIRNEDFQREINADQERIQMKVLGKKFDNEQSMFDAEGRRIQQQQGWEEGLQEDNQAHDFELAKLQMGARESTNAQSQLASQFEEAKEDFQNKYSEMLDFAGAEYNLGMDNKGKPVIQLNGMGFENEVMDVDEFRNATLQHRRAYDRYKDAEQVEDPIESSENSSAYDWVSTQDGEFNYYAKEPFMNRVQSSISNGAFGTGSFGEGLVSGINRMNTQSRVDSAKENFNAYPVWGNLVSEPTMTFDNLTDNDPITIDFETNTLSEVRRKVTQIKNDIGTSGANGKREEATQQQVTNNRYLKTLMEKADAYERMILAGADKLGIGDGSVIGQLRMNTNVQDRDNPASYIITPDSYSGPNSSSGNTSQARNSSLMGFTP